MLDARQAGTLNRLTPLMLAALLAAGLGIWLLWSSGPAGAQVQDDAAPAVANLSCRAETGLVAFLWLAPEWSGGEVYAYDYEWTLPGGGEQRSRLGKGPSASSLVFQQGSYSAGQETRFKVRAVFRTGSGDVTGAERELVCWVGGAPPQPANEAPTVAAAISDAAIVHASGTKSVSLTGVFSDADNDSLTITAASSNTAVATVSVSSDYATLTLTAQSRGAAAITVTANDGNGGAVSDAFTVSVKASPTVVSPLADVFGLEAESTQEVSLSGVFSDADGDTLTITAKSSNDAAARVSAALDGSKLTLAAVAEGAATITVTARDTDGNTVSDAFDVSVSALPALQQSPAVSSDATLDGLALLDRDGNAVALRPAFDPQVTEYGAAMLTGNGYARLRPRAAGAGAAITVDGKTVVSGQESLNVLLGLNAPKRFAVVVTAADGTTREYGVTATYRPRAALHDLTISAGALHPRFASNETSFRAWVPHSVESIKVTPTNRYDKGTITVNGRTVASGRASQAIALPVGETVITVKITAPDNYTSSTHTITVARASASESADASLSGLAVYRATSKQPDAGDTVPYTGAAFAMTPAFQSGVYEYVVKLTQPAPNADRPYLTTVATTTAPGAKSIAVSGRQARGEVRPPKRQVVTGEASGPWEPSVGRHPVKITVTSLDGEHTRTYWVILEMGTVDAPAGVTLTPGDGELTLAWDGSRARTAPFSFLARWRKAGETAWLNQAADGEPGYTVGFGPNQRAWTAADGFFASLERRPTAENGGSHKITGLENGVEYEVQLRGARGGSSYDLNLNWLASGWVTVKGTPGAAAKRPLTITPASPTRVYGGTDDLSYTVSGLVDGDAAADVVTGTLARASGDDAGSYAINLGTLAVASAYAQKYTLPSAPAVASYTITPKAITAVGGVAVNERPADGTTSATFDTSAATGTGVLAAELADFRAGGLQVSGAFPAATAGTHSLSVTYSLHDQGSFKAGNYTLSATSATLRGELTAAAPADCQTAARSDYDADDDGLIEVCNLAQLNAVRWDLDGDGVHMRGSAHEYTAAFPGILANGPGCPPSGCRGYELSADLDFDTNGSGRADAGDEYWNDGWGWAPIGREDQAFSAVFDGNGFAIRNLYIIRQRTYNNLLGLFQENRGSIRNLRLEQAYVSSRGELIGALVGKNHGTISNAHMTGTVRGGHNDVGGLVGENHGAVSNSSADATVSAGTNVGGEGGTDIGGLVGESHAPGRIMHSHASGAVSGRKAVGGLVGRLLGGTIGLSRSEAGVNGTHASRENGREIGGLVGDSQGRIYASYATGAVSGKADNVGGLAGRNAANSNIVASYALGAVSSSGMNVGGLVGYNDWRITASFAAGRVAGAANAGGLVGTHGGSKVAHSYWDTQASGQTRGPVGSGKTTAELQRPTGYTGIYADWNQVDANGDGHPDDVWNFGAADQYPTLKTNLAPGRSLSSTGGRQFSTDRNRVTVTAYADLNAAGADDLAVTGLALPQDGTITPEFSSGHKSYRLTVPHDVDHLVFTGRFAVGDYPAFATLTVGLQGEYENTAPTDFQTVNRLVIAASSGEAGANRIALAPGAETVITIVVRKTRPDYRLRYDIHQRNEHVAKAVYTLTVIRPSATTDKNRVNVTASTNHAPTGALVTALALPAGATIAPAFRSDHDRYRVTVPHDVDHLSFAGKFAVTEAYDRTSSRQSYTVLTAELHGEYDAAQARSRSERRDAAERLIIATSSGLSGTSRIELSGDEATTISLGLYATRRGAHTDLYDGWQHVTNRFYTLIVTRAPPPTAGQQQTTNHPPAVAAAMSDATIVDTSGTQTVSLSGVFSDADSDSLTMTADSSNEAVATASVSAGYSTLTLSAQSRGAATITVTADDGNGGVVEDTFTVTVKAAPTVASPLADVSGLEVDATEEVSLSGVFRDADGDSLTISAASSDYTIATATVASDGSTLTLTGAGVGTATITVSARDTDGNTVSDAFDAPVARKYAGLIAQMYQWRNDQQWSSYKSHTDKWDRVLLAFGETVADGSLTAMTAAEAQAFADTPNGQRWVPVAAALWEIEAG